jgi:hypothetical protein
MADKDLPESPPPQPVATGARCPWCSTPVASPDAITCGVCGATLTADAEVEIPGVTAIDAQHAMRAAAPRKVRRTFGALFVGRDDEIPPPSEVELPALAPPDADVRREMLRIQLDAELANLTARAAALAAERGIVIPGPPAGAREPDASPDSAGPPPAPTAELPAEGPTASRRTTRPDRPARGRRR